MVARMKLRLPHGAFVVSVLLTAAPSAPSPRTLSSAIRRGSLALRRVGRQGRAMRAHDPEAASWKP